MSLTCMDGYQLYMCAPIICIIGPGAVATWTGTVRYHNAKQAYSLDMC